MGAQTNEVIQSFTERQQCELAGMFNSKKGITMYYTSIKGMDVEEAIPKIKAECELRGIDFNEQPVKPKEKKDMWGNIEGLFEKGAVLTNKYPIIKDIGAPIIKAFAAGAGTAILGVIAGKKATSDDDIEEDAYSEEIANNNSPALELNFDEQPQSETDTAQIVK